jgi:hypothetical protein
MLILRTLIGHATVMPVMTTGTTLIRPVIAL